MIHGSLGTRSLGTWPTMPGLNQNPLTLTWEHDRVNSRANLVAIEGCARAGGAEASQGILCGLNRGLVMWLDLRHDLHRHLELFERAARRS